MDIDHQDAGTDTASRHVSDPRNMAGFQRRRGLSFAKLD